MISDEVVDAIASIELHRQEMAKEASVAAACNEALRKLHELLERERAQPGVRQAAHIEAVTAEIARVKRLAGGAAKPGHGRPQGRGAPRPGGPRNVPRHERRRTSGRGGRGR